MYTKQMITQMLEDKETKVNGIRSRLSSAIVKFKDLYLDFEVTKIYIDYTLLMEIPKTKHEYIKYLESKDMEWQGWTEPNQRA